jgi:hypothetical protein
MTNFDIPIPFALPVAFSQTRKKTRLECQVVVDSFEPTAKRFCTILFSFFADVGKIEKRRPSAQSHRYYVSTIF